MNSVQEINIKDCMHCFSDALINKTNFDPNKSR